MCSAAYMVSITEHFLISVSVCLDLNVRRRGVKKKYHLLFLGQALALMVIGLALLLLDLENDLMPAPKSAASQASL